MAISDSSESTRLPEMGVREFLRGGYQSIRQPVQITKFGKVIGVYTPVSNFEPTTERTIRGPFYFSTRRR